MGDDVRVTVIAAGFERWEEGGRGQTKSAGTTPSGSSQVLGLDPVHEDIFATPGEDDLDLGDDEFDVPSFLR
jgi:cell division protein FtsZ